jgi:hypothetical protein
MGQQQNGFYNFGAADDLQSALNLASEKLVDFGTYRAHLLSTDLGSTEHGHVFTTQVTGWAGTGYDSWTLLFNADQRSLQDAASTLKSLAAQVNNATYTAYQANGVNPPITQLPTNVSVPNLPTAEPHAHPDGLECGTPEKMYDYANRTKAQHDLILPTCTKVLQGKIDDYYAGSKSAYHSLIPDIEGLDIAPMIVDQVFGALSNCLGNDQYVQSVGAAFERAGNSVTFTQLTTANYNRDVYDNLTAENNAQQLAQQMNADGLTPALLAELAKYENDPAFAAEFLNSLDHKTLLLLILEPWPKGSPPGTVGFKNYSHDVLALILAALGSGSLDKQVCNTLVDEMHLVDMAGFNQQFFADLSNDPAAAAAFFSSLDNAHLSVLLNGNFSGPGSSSQKEAQIIALMTESLSYIASTDGPEAAKLFYQRASSLIMQTQPADAVAVLRDAEKFFGLYIAISIPPPAYDAGPAAITSWARGIGQSINKELRTWLNWISSFESKNLSDQTNREAIESFAVGIFLSLVLPEGVLFDVASSAITSWGVSWVDQHILPLTGNAVTDRASMHDTAMYAVEYVAIVDAVAARDIVGPWPDDKVVTASDIKDVLDHPDRYRIRGTDNFQTVQEYLETVQAQFAAEK